MDKKNIVILLMIILFAASVGVCFWFWKEQNKNDLPKDTNGALADNITKEEPVKSELISLSDRKTYSNQKVNFTFKYPADWEVKEEFEYRSAACEMDPKCKGVWYIALNRIRDTRPAINMEAEKFGIAINMSQCWGIKGDYRLAGGNWICVFDDNPEALNVYEQIKKSFSLIDYNIISDMNNNQYYSSNIKGKINLKDGIYYKNSDLTKTSFGIRFSIEKYAIGDLNGDGKNDAAVVLKSFNEGGSIPVYDINVLTSEDEKLVWRASNDFAYGAQIKSVNIQSGEINLDVIVPDLNDMPCCPTVEKTFRYKVTNSGIVDSMATACLSSMSVDLCEKAGGKILKSQEGESCFCPIAADCEGACATVGLSNVAGKKCDGSEGYRPMYNGATSCCCQKCDNFCKAAGLDYVYTGIDDCKAVDGFVPMVSGAASCCCKKPSENAVVDWLTYENINLGLKFEYPKNWGLIKQATQNNDGIYAFTAENGAIEQIFYHNDSKNLFFVEESRKVECENKKGDCFVSDLKIIGSDKEIKIIYQMSVDEAQWYAKINKLYFSPDAKYAYFMITGYENSTPVLLNIEKKSNILEKLDIWFGDAFKNVNWFNDSILAIKSERNDFGGVGKNAIFVSDLGSRDILNEIFSIENKDYWNGSGFSEGLSFDAEGKLQFSTRRCVGTKCEILKKYEYNPITKQLIDSN